MSALQLVYLLSASGAVLFFLAGYVLRSFRAAPASGPAILPAEQIRAQRLDPTLTTLKQVREELQLEQKRTKELEGQSKELQLSLANLGKRLNEATRQPTEKAPSAPSTGPGTQPAQLQEDFAELEATCARLRIELSRMQTENFTLQEDKALLLHEKEVLQGIIADLNAEHPKITSENQHLLQKIAQLEQEQSRRQGEVATQRDGLELLRRAVAEAQAEQSRCRQQVKAAERALIEEHEASAARLTGMEAQLRELREQYRQAEQRLAEGEKTRAERLLTEQRDVDELEQQVQQLNRELRDTRVRLQISQQRLGEMETHRDQLRHLQEELATLQGQHGELATLRSDNRDLRVAAEVAARRQAEFEGRIGEIAELQRQLEESSWLAQECEGLRQRIRLLEAQLVLAGQAPGQPRSDNLPTISPPRTSIDACLTNLAQAHGVRCSVLADRMGLLVAAAGMQEYQEGIAALAGLAERLAESFPRILPMPKIQMIQITDTQALTVAFRLFHTANEFLILSTMSAGPPPARLMDDTVRRLSVALT